MKGLVFLCFTFLFFLQSPVLFGAQPNREANKLARDGTEAANNKQWDQAVDALRKAADLDHKYLPNLGTALQQRAAARVSESQFPEALADLNDALKIQPRQARIYETRAYVEMKLNDLDAAQADYSAAIKLEPDELRYYQLRSYIREVKGDYKGSMADTEKILSRDQNNAEAKARKARLVARMAQNAPFTPPPPRSPNQSPAQTKPRP